MKRITIHVTEQDIRDGLIDDPWSCPVARALAAHGFVPFVSSDEMKFPKMGWADNPQSVKQFIRRFDAGEPVEPFTFRITLPDDIAASYHRRPA